MDKDTRKNLVGQPIFKQLINLLPKSKFYILVGKHKSDRYYKAFSSSDQLLTLLFGAFSRCDSMRALDGKLNYLGMDKSPAKSTAGYRLRDRSNELYKDLYFVLITHFSSILSVSRIHGISFEKFYAFDSTTISLFSVIMKGVGRNLKGDGKKKGGLKVYKMVDAHADTAKFVTINEAKRHVKLFLENLVLPPNSTN